MFANDSAIQMKSSQPGSLNKLVTHHDGIAARTNADC
jgi:hypothetical protein